MRYENINCNKCGWRGQDWVIVGDKEKCPKCKEKQHHSLETKRHKVTKKETNMNASFDGARKNLSQSYNKLAQLVNEEPVLCKEDITTEMNDLQSAIGVLLCMHDPDCDGDSNDMSDSINLICVE